jgi:hypothetical protein
VFYQATGGSYAMPAGVCVCLCVALCVRVSLSLCARGGRAHDCLCSCVRRVCVFNAVSKRCGTYQYHTLHCIRTHSS